MCASDFLSFILRSTLATSAACPILVLSLRTIWSNQTCIAAGGVPDPQLSKLSRVFASKKASSFFMKQRDLLWAPGKEAKTSKIPRVSACSRVISVACVGHVTATRLPPPDLCL